jgi:hypothetical protein
MDIFTFDIAIVGVGGARLRAAIAVAESDPSLALISKVYPMRSRWRTTSTTPWPAATGCASRTWSSTSSVHAHEELVQLEQGVVALRDCRCAIFRRHRVGCDSIMVSVH